MRRRAERQLLPGQAEPLDAALLDERERLEHLDRGTNEAHVSRVAGARGEPLLGVHDRDVDAMPGLDDFSAIDLDDAVPVRIGQKAEG